MADKRIIDLPVFSGGIQLKPADILPIHNVTSTATEQITGQQIMNGVLDTTNQTLFNDIHYNEDQVIRLITEGSKPPGAGQFAYQTIDITTNSVTSARTWLIKFRVMVVDFDNRSNTSEYTAILMQNNGGGFVVNPLVLSTILGQPETGKTLVKMFEVIQGTNPISSVEVYASSWNPAGYIYPPGTEGIYIKVNITGASLATDIKIISETIRNIV